MQRAIDDLQKGKDDSQRAIDDLQRARDDMKIAIDDLGMTNNAGCVGKLSSSVSLARLFHNLLQKPCIFLYEKL